MDRKLELLQRKVDIERTKCILGRESRTEFLDFTEFSQNLK